MIYDKRECAQSVDCPGEKTAAALKTKQTVDSTSTKRNLDMSENSENSETRRVVLHYLMLCDSETKLN